MPTVGLPIPDLIDDFARSLRAKGRSPKTIRAYTDAVRRFATWLAEGDHPVDVESIQRRHVEAFVVGWLESHTPSTAASYYRWLQQFFRWCVAEEEIASSPMEGMSPPKLSERPVPIFDEDDLRRLLQTCEGQGFEERRDTAIIRLFIATGIRLGEMATLTVDRLARDEQAALVIGKGDRGRWVPYGDKAAAALDRYLRARRRHYLHEHAALWLGQRGALSESGIAQMLRRRGERAGVDGVHPHRFRHTSAHRAQTQGLAESDLMEVMGWRSPEMVRRYGASARSERARANFRKIDIEGDV
jgi:site-specific recombinase XerD